MSRLQRQLELGKAKEKFIKISDIVLFATVLKMVRFIIVILALSFITGLVWFVWSHLEGHIFGTLNFCSEFGLEENSISRNVALLTYFSFTTFSTVGLGDLHPISNSERLVASAAMLFGVMVTSFLIDNFS